MKHNRLKDKSGRALGKLISTLKTLKELDLEDNEIAMEGCGAIAHALKKDQVKFSDRNKGHYLGSLLRISTRLFFIF